MPSRLSASALKSRGAFTGPVSSVRWRGKGGSRATQSVASSRRPPAQRKRAVRPGGSSAGSRRALDVRSSHQTIPRSLGHWCAYGNLPVQAATQTVLINVRTQFSLVTSTAVDTNMFFYPGANDTIGWYTNGTTNVALANNTTTGAGFSTLTVPMLTSMLTGSPRTAPEWRPTRLWVRIHNTTLFTNRVGGLFVTRPRGSWSNFSPGIVGPGQVVSAANISALPETRFFDFSQLAGPTEYVIGTFPTDLESFAYANTTAPDTPGLSTNWLTDVTAHGQLWAPLNFYIPAASAQQTIVFEVYASYDCKISEVLTGTSPMATLSAPPPVGAPESIIRGASAALHAGSDNMRAVQTALDIMGLGIATPAGAKSLLPRSAYRSKNLGSLHPLM